VKKATLLYWVFVNQLHVVKGLLLSQSFNLEITGQQEANQPKLYSFIKHMNQQMVKRKHVVYSLYHLKTESRENFT